MANLIIKKLSKTFDYIRSFSPLSDKEKRVTQIVIDEFQKDDYDSTICYNLVSNLSTKLFVGKYFACNRVFYEKLVVGIN